MPVVIVNVALLASVTVASVVEVTRTFAVVVAVEGTVQEMLPFEAVTLEDTTDQVAPLSSEDSTFTVLTLLEVQVMLCALPATQDSPPFGEVTVTEAVVVVSEGSAKSRTTPMCCMFVAPLSVESAGLISEIGE